MVLQITRASGFIGTTSQTAEYDGLSRKTECTDNNDPTTTSDDLLCNYAFDSLSRKVEETQKIGTLTAKVISCNYDSNAAGTSGAKSSCIYPEGRQVDRTYDKLDRLTSLQDNGQASAIAEWEYIAGRVATMTYQNETRLTHIGQNAGQNADIGFDNMRRIVNHRWESFTGPIALGNGTLIVGFEHQDGQGTPNSMYDRMNNKKIEYKTHDPSNSEQYKYDSVYRITSRATGSQGVDVRAFEQGTFTDATRSSMSGGVTNFQDWDLDANGNWERADLNGTVETRDHTDFNEIDKRIISGQNSSITLDKNGNTTDNGYSSNGGSTFAGGGLRLEYDALNRVRKVYDNNNTPGTTGDDTLIVTYIYDCGNRRMRKMLAGGGQTDYYYCGWQVLEEHDGTDTITQQYTYGLYLDEPLTLDDRSGAGSVGDLNDGSGQDRLFYHHNTQYHVYGLTDESGNLVEAYQYDAYGLQTVISDGNDGDAIVNFGANDVRSIGGVSNYSNPHMYTGQRFDGETGLMYFKYRFLDPNAGRFLTRDPIGYHGGTLGLYEYVGGNPIGLVDPYGTHPVAASAAAAKVAAILLAKYLLKKSVQFLKWCKKIRCRVKTHRADHSWLLPRIKKPFKVRKCWMKHAQATCWIKGKKGKSWNARVPYGKCYRYRFAKPPTTH